MAMVYCRGCGKEIHETAQTCPHCGAQQGKSNARDTESVGKSGVSYNITLLLCFFFGIFGAHRFYAGKIGSGIIMALTAGGFLLWTFFDFVMLLSGKFKDAKGNLITNL